MQELRLLKALASGLKVVDDIVYTPNSVSRNKRNRRRFHIHKDCLMLVKNSVRPRFRRVVEEDMEMQVCQKCVGRP